MKRVTLLLLSAMLVGISMTIAQPWMTNVPPADQGNFYAIQKAFKDYWQGREIQEEEEGWAQFKRWEWYWEPRVYPTGEMPDRMQLYTEYKKELETGRRKSVTGNQSPAAANWTELGPSQSPGGYAGLGRLNCVRTDPNNTSIIWVGSASGGLWKSTDAGITWSSNTDELPSLGVTDVAIDPANPNTMYIATGDGDAGDDYSIGVLKSTDGGTTWNTTGLNWQTSQATVLSRLLMSPNDPNLLIAAGSGIFKTTDGGATWVQTSSIRIHDLEFKPGDPSIVYACGAASNVYRSTDAGSTWSTIGSGFPTNGQRVSIGVTPASPSYIYALVVNSSSGFLGLYRSTNSGDSWSLRSNSPNILGYNQDGSDAGGQGWYDLAIAASQTNGEVLYTGGVNIWKSTNGGTSWTLSTFWYSIPGVSEVHADKHDLYFTPGTNVLFTGCDGGVYRTTDSGANWNWIGAGLKITQFYRLGTSRTDPDRLIGGAQDNGTKILNDNSWFDVIGGDGMEALVDYSDANIMYGELYYGDIQKTTNGGISWVSIGGGIPESGGWVTPYVIDPTDPATLYAGFQHVWKTTNRGSSWTSISNFGAGTLTIVAVDPSKPDVIYAGNGGIFYKTTDGGSSNWSAIAHPAGAGTITGMAIHPLDPDHIWMTSSGFTAGQKVYESTDGGTTWTNISGSLPNIPANCVVYQDNSPDRIYVGTDLGVFYRDQTTGDWQDFNEGLANVSVTELELTYATNKIRAATYGRGIWESDAVANEGAVIGLSQSTVSFGRIEVGHTSDTVSVSITNFGAIDSLVITSIMVSSPDVQLISLPSLPISLGPLETTSFQTLFVPQGAGDVADSIVIVSNASNGTTLRVPVSGRGVVIGQAQTGVMYAAGSSMYTVDTGTGSVTTLGETGLAEIQSIAVRPTTHELYGALSGPSTSTIYRMSAGTGDALPVVTFPVGYLRAIAFTTNDELFGAAAFGPDAGKLFQLDLSNGVATYIGTAPSVNYSALSFSPTSGTLWASTRPPVGIKDKIYTVNTGTGEATLVGETGFPTRITAAIAFDPSGLLYGITGSGAQTNEFISIDTETATGTLIGSMGTTGLTALTQRIDSLTLGVGPQTHLQIPEQYLLEQNFPNPFNPSTEIRYGLPLRSHVTLLIYNMLGQEIARLMDGMQNAGYHTVSWDGTSSAGSAVASGIYFYKLEAAGDAVNFRSIKKMLFVK